MNQIKAVSVLDGRYYRYTRDFEDIFSEYGLIKHRVFVEAQWLKFILEELKLDGITTKEIKIIDKIKDDFNTEHALRVKEIEKTTNHDVKAVEYFIKEELVSNDLSKIKEWVHFACTSEDINNTAYAIMLKKGKEKILNILNEVLKNVERLAKKHKTIPMMSRTHGQAASPTTVGKEFVNFAWRIKKELSILKNIDIEAKINGATGNYNAHYFVYPQINWIEKIKNLYQNI